MQSVRLKRSGVVKHLLEARDFSRVRLHYCLKNACQGWSYGKMDLEEIDVLNKLYEEKHLIHSTERILVSREFYDFMQDILAIGYVEEFI